MSYKATKSGKSHKTCLTNNKRSISHYWLLISSGADTHMPMCKPKQFQETRPQAGACLVLKDTIGIGKNQLTVIIELMEQLTNYTKFMIYFVTYIICC